MVHKKQLLQRHSTQLLLSGMNSWMCHIGPRADNLILLEVIVLSHRANACRVHLQAWFKNSQNHVLTQTGQNLAS